jgi:hypothetical protein
MFYLRLSEEKVVFSMSSGKGVGFCKPGCCAAFSPLQKISSNPTVPHKVRNRYTLMSFLLQLGDGNRLPVACPLLSL